MSVLDKVFIDLPPTATYARRECEWTPTEPGEGVLTIRLYKGRRAGSKIETDHYHVQEEQRPEGAPGRSFLLLNVEDTLQPDVYRCVPDQGACTCKAGNCRVPLCKHRDAIAALIEDGSL